MKNKEIRELDYDTRIKVWMHYVAKQLVSIHVPLVFNLNESRFEISKVFTH